MSYERALRKMYKLILGDRNISRITDKDLEKATRSDGVTDREIAAALAGSVKNGQKRMD